MDVVFDDIALKSDLEPMITICRCCLSTERRALSVYNFRIRTLFSDLADIKVSESDGLPPWICYECYALLEKAVKFKYKLLRAHTMLFDYVGRCAPFQIHAQDEELSQYRSPHLCATLTLSVDVDKDKLGFHKVLEHEKQLQKNALDSIEIRVCERVKQEVSMDDVNQNGSLSDYEDNMTLQEYKNINNETEDQVAEDVVKDRSDHIQGTGENEKEDRRKRKKKKDKENKVKKKKERWNDDQESLEAAPERKSSIRKIVEVDPTKIRVVTLDPEEQVRQREEENKANKIKFPFQCHLCYRGFNFESKLQNHMFKHNPTRGKFKCSLCTIYLPTVYSYKVHCLTHTRRYECLQCHRRMLDKFSIMDHYRSQHEGVTKLYTCEICGKVSSNNKTHHGHMRNIHSTERPECEKCGKTFVNKDSLVEHMLIHQGIKSYTCTTCGAQFRTRTQMVNHHLTHTDEKKFYCVECDVRFKSNHSLRHHLSRSLKHRDNTSLQFPCERCPKRFETSKRLQHHTTVQHFGVKAFKCPFCAVALASHGSVMKHIRSVHQGHRPSPKHVCDMCGKAFRAKSMLVNHIRTHTGEKPFACAQCGRQFSQRTAMNTHVKLVHLKLRRSDKIKPEVHREPEVSEPDKMNVFTKEARGQEVESWKVVVDW